MFRSFVSNRHLNRPGIVSMEMPRLGIRVPQIRSWPSCAPVKAFVICVRSPQPCLIPVSRSMLNATPMSQPIVICLPLPIHGFPIRISAPTRRNCRLWVHYTFPQNLITPAFAEALKCQTTIEPNPRVSPTTGSLDPPSTNFSN